jgi:hypothetical protein
MKKAVLSFRNPSKVEKTFEVIVTKVFDLPDNLSDSYAFYEVRKMKETEHKQISLHGRTFRITLLPFEIKVFDAFPAN